MATIFNDQINPDKYGWFWNNFTNLAPFIHTLSLLLQSKNKEDHIENILDELPEKYDSFVTTIISQLDPYTIDEIWRNVMTGWRSE